MPLPPSHRPSLLPPHLLTSHKTSPLYHHLRLLILYHKLLKRIRHLPQELADLIHTHRMASLRVDPPFLTIPPITLPQGSLPSSVIPIIHILTLPVDTLHIRFIRMLHRHLSKGRPPVQLRVLAVRPLPLHLYHSTGIPNLHLIRQFLHIRPAYIHSTRMAYHYRHQTLTCLPQTIFRVMKT